MESQDTTSKNKIEGEGQDKKRLVKEDDIFGKAEENEEEAQIDVKQTGFDDLPPEMFIKIVKKLDVSSLFSACLVNKKWNEISKEILQTQTQISFRSKVEYPRNFKGKNGNLEEFMQFFKNSKDFPYAHYYFELACCEFYSGELGKFFLLCKDNIKSLKLKLICLYSHDDVEKVSETLKDLLLNQLPNLEEFGLKTDCGQNKIQYTEKSQYKLFSKSVQVELPHLKTVCLSPWIISEFPGIAEDILKAAINLKKFDRFAAKNNSSESWRASHFKVFHSVGKMHLIQSAEIMPSDRLLSWIENCAKEGNPIGFKLSKLMLKHYFKDDDSPQIWPFYSIQEPSFSVSLKIQAFINMLFDSVQNTLTELFIADLRVLDNLQQNLKFSKLRKFATYSNETKIPPRGIRLKIENFPVLSELDLSHVNWDVLFPGQDLIPNISSVRILTIFAPSLTGESIEKMAMFYPNLIEFKISGCLQNFPDVGRSIWTHMKKLELLNLSISGESQENSLIAINSTFTGFSMATCQLLLDKIKSAKKPMPKAKKLKAEASLKISESELMKMREHASILDLKDLRKLDVELDLDVSTPEDPCFFDVSKMYAFDQMPKVAVSTEESKLRSQIQFYMSRMIAGL